MFGKKPPMGGMKAGMKPGMGKPKGAAKKAPPKPMPFKSGGMMKGKKGC